MSNADQPGTPNPSQALAQRVTRAMDAVHRARQRYLRARSLVNSSTPADEAAALLHAANIEYYYALRPLIGGNAAEDTWETAVLWTEERFYGYDEHGRPVVNEDDVRGLDELQNWVQRSRTTEQEVEGFMGARTITRESPEHLPPKVSLRVSYLLDKVAVELGFSPDLDQDVMRAVLEEGVDPNEKTTVEGAETPVSADSDVENTEDPDANPGGETDGT